MGASMVSCDDFINDSREPLSSVVVNSTFWSNEQNVLGQTNYFYQIFTGYGNGSSYGDFYFNTASDDQAGTVGGEFRDWRVQTVPTSSTAWSTPYTHIRRANLIITNLESEANTLEHAPKMNALGIARLFRAYEYYQLVRAYGDVPYIDFPLDVTDDAQLFGPRTDRNVVMDNALADLDYAIANIGTAANTAKFSQDLARAIKTEVCLFEASYQRYVAKDENRAKKYFAEVVSAADPLVAKYVPGNTIESYVAIYQSLNGALLANTEVIFAKAYNKGVFMHSTMDYTCGSTPIAGITKDAFDSFLYLDGKPASQHTESDMATLESDGSLSIQAQIDARDKRLDVITYPVVMYENQPYMYVNTANMTSTTGYGVKKYNNTAIPTADATVANKGYTDAPLYWGAYIGLCYAEARAELDQLTDADLNNTLNILFTRAGLPTKTVQELKDMNDPAKDADVSSLLWEIRRCRRCETMLDRDIRYWDLIRWNKLEKMDTQKYPNCVLGALIPETANKYNVTANAQGYINPVNLLFGGKERVYDAKYNLYPVPSGQIQLNPNLTQNPGW